MNPQGLTSNFDHYDINNDVFEKLHMSSFLKLSCIEYIEDMLLLSGFKYSPSITLRTKYLSNTMKTIRCQSLPILRTLSAKYTVLSHVGHFFIVFQSDPNLA